MKTRSLKKLIPIILLVCLFTMLAACSTIERTKTPNKLFDGTTSFKKVDGISDGYELNEALSIESIENSITYSADDMVWAIVVMGDGIARSSINTGYNSVRDYALSSYGQDKIAMMKTSQSNLIKEIGKSEIDIQIKYNYITLLNGFAAYVRYGDLAKIKAMNGVEAVSVSHQYSIPETTQTDSLNIFAGTGIHNSASTYGGLGTTVAIIDTGVDYYHNAFMTEPEWGAFNYDYIEDMLPLTNAYANMNGELSTDMVYVNGKVPFQFDYIDNDPDAIPGFELAAFNGGEHGTHCAGIAVGNNEVIKGAAYDAQLIPMKVFGDNGAGAYDVDICAALEDCILLGVDVASLSLGKDCGFVKEIDPELLWMNDLYDLTAKCGLIVNIATGNTSSAFFYSDTLKSFNKPSNPDNGVVSSPASYEAAFAIGSIENYNGNCVVLNNKTLKIYDSVGMDEVTYNFYDILGDDIRNNYEFKVVPNYGTNEDYIDIDVKGKVAIVSRGEISFTEKMDIAAKHGAIAIIIYNNEETNMMVRAQLEHQTIPCATTDIENGKLFVSLGSGEITIDSTKHSLVHSYFSSMGALSDLSIGVDLCGIGGNVYSAVPEYYDWVNGTNGYVYMSGTSMATPNVAGTSAALLGYLKNKYPDKTTAELRKMVYQLLMSTAELVIEDDLPVTPRQQGAGLANLQEAIDTNAYLTVTGCDRTKLNLGSDINKDGIYTLNFNLVNIGDKALSYDVSLLAFTETTWNNPYNNQIGILQQAHMFSNYTMTVSAINGNVESNTVTVEAGQTASITVRFILTDEDKAYMDANFVNGIYVEGFAVLNGENKLSIPFIAFYGDWNNLPIFDSCYYDEEKATYSSGGLYLSTTTNIIYDEDGNFMRANEFAFVAGMYFLSLPDGYIQPNASQENIAVTCLHEDKWGWGIGTVLDTMAIIALRDISTLYYEIVEDATGEIIDSGEVNNIGKKCAKNNLAYYFSLDSSKNMLASNQRYTINIKAAFNGVLQDDTMSESFFVDMIAPILRDASWRNEDGRWFIDLTVYDNHKMMATGLLTAPDDTGKYTDLFKYAIPCYNFPIGQTGTYSIDVTDYLGNINNNIFAVELMDYATNSAIYEIELPEELKQNEINSQNIIQNYYNTNRHTYSQSSEDIYRITGYNPTDVYNQGNEEGDEFVIDENGVLTAYNGIGGDIIVPDGVKSIGQNVFRDNDEIRSITLPEGVISIEASGIAYLKNCTKVHLPSTLESIKYALSGMVNLNSLNLEDTNVSYIEGGLEGFKSLKEIKLPDADKPLQLFFGLSVIFNMEKITFLGEVDIIANAVKCIDGLKKIEFMKKVNSIDGESIYGSGSFSLMYLDDLEEIIFHDDVKSLGYSENWGYGIYNAPTCVALPQLRKIEFLGNVGQLTGDFGNSCPNLAEIIFHKNFAGIVSGAGTFGNCPKLAKGYTISDDNEYLIKEVDDVVYNLNKTKMYIPFDWDYNGVFTLPETITSLDGITFGLAPSEYLPSSPIFGIEEDKYIWYSLNIDSCDTRYSKKNMTGIILNNSITSLPNYAFFNCEGLKSLNMDNITEFGDKSLAGTGIESLIINENVSRVGKVVFSGCKYLKKITFSPNAEYVSFDNMFYGLTSIEEIVVPEYIQIGMEGVRNCKNLKKITLLGETPRYIDYDAFRDDINLIEIVGSESIVSINGGAFMNCISLKNINLPNLEYIDYAVFSGCTSLEYINWTDKLSTIIMYNDSWTSPVAECYKLKSIYIPEKVTNLNISLFLADCINLEEIVINENNKAYISIDGIAYDKAMTEILKFPANSQETEIELPETVTSLGDSIFKGAKNLKKIFMPGVRTIGDYTFKDSALFEVIADNIQIVGTETFMNAPIENIDLSHLIFVGQNAFTNTRLSEITLNNLIFADVKAFADIKTLTTINLGNVAAFNINLVFYGCRNIVNYNISKECETFTIEDDILYNGTKTIIYKYLGNADKVVIAEGVKKIEIEAFMNTTIKEVIFPSTLVAIGDKAFYGCNLKLLEFKSEKAPSLEALYGDSTLPYANFVKEITEVGEGLDIEIICNGDASYNTYIWSLYFKK